MDLGDKATMIISNLFMTDRIDSLVETLHILVLIDNGCEVFPVVNVFDTV